MKSFILFLIFLCIVSYSFAGTYWVANTNDTGDGSLRECITLALSTSGQQDYISFALSTADSNYNSETGVWTITLNSELPLINSTLITIDGNTQQQWYGDTNPNGPEVQIIGGGLEYCFRIAVWNISVKNLCISGFDYGFQFYGTMCHSQLVEGNYIGTNYDGTLAEPNDFGVGISGNAHNITFRNNLISGNTTAGIGVSEAYDLYFYGNKIGTDITGAYAIPNATGILTENMYNSHIGSINVGDRNLISGNTDCGIMIYNTGSYNNEILGNYIGTNSTCNDTIPNGNGIMIVSSAGNIIGGTDENAKNVISGNRAAGIVINGTGANENLIKGNYIGVDATGNAPLSNHYGVIIKGDADNNLVGGNSAATRNVISANHEIGVYIEASDGNVVSGNYIGTNLTGEDAFYYEGTDSLIQANGVEINTVSKFNVIGGNEAGEGNVISGNRVYGAIYYGQVSENNIAGNLIGLDATGSYAIPNATGICVDDASNHNTIENNVLSGNVSYGLFIVTTGSDFNVFRGNIVGLNIMGEFPIPNDVGLLIGGGAKNNIIGGDSELDRNVFSGNNYGGIEISDNGTDFNLIKGNYIGTDMSGMSSLPNIFGVGVANLAGGNIIENNTISGNTTFGIVLTDNSELSEVYSNNIGLASDGLSDLGNGGAGIAITAGASNNIIGSIANPNIIAYNDSTGIVIADNTTINNRISGNSIYNNEYLGIDILPAGVNDNDEGDADMGPNMQMNFPVITMAIYDLTSNLTFFSGFLDSPNPIECLVEIYIAEPDLTFYYGEGRTHIVSAVPGYDGIWFAQVEFLPEGLVVTSLAIDADGNTSEFSATSDVISGINALVLDSDVFGVFPNPTNGNFSIILHQSNDKVEIRLYDCSGRYIQTLFSGTTDAEILNFNSVSLGLEAGMYVIRILSDDNKSELVELSVVR
jgi:parallel beta-helix repeat protein